MAGGLEECQEAADALRPGLEQVVVGDLAMRPVPLQRAHGPLHHTGVLWRNGQQGLQGRVGSAPDLHPAPVGLDGQGEEGTCARAQLGQSLHHAGYDPRVARECPQQLRTNAPERAGRELLRVGEQHQGERTHPTLDLLGFGERGQRLLSRLIDADEGDGTQTRRDCGIGRTRDRQRGADLGQDEGEGSGVVAEGQTGAHEGLVDSDPGRPLLDRGELGQEHMDAPRILAHPGKEARGQRPVRDALHPAQPLRERLGLGGRDASV